MRKFPGEPARSMSSIAGLRLRAASLEGSFEATRGRDWLARKLLPLKSIRRRDVS
jgi:hypothetical protein